MNEKIKTEELIEWIDDKIKNVKNVLSKAQIKLSENCNYPPSHQLMILQQIKVKLKKYREYEHIVDISIKGLLKMRKRIEKKMKDE